ncbi:UNKNOWN [Stylonychia lemnae]|uniref:Uncharacterized protein n=1 Tax=Stylonychia lemnae TaxID=5949 RepID=A0A077ZWB1_STYLE|nr:UNKNOWN [Stylonychia lemnae]|eukprot:CDW72731.1 UNKNOWN [Stylonychia lemnae]
MRDEKQYSARSLMPLTLLDHKKNLQFDRSTHHFRVQQNHISRMVIPKFSPYKECALFDKKDQLNLNHENNLSYRLDKINQTFDSKSNRFSPERENYTQETYSKHLQDKANQVIPQEQMTYMLRQAHTRTIDSRPISPNELKSITTMEMFKKEKNQPLKKKLNYVNFSDLKHNIITNDPINLKLTIDSNNFQRATYQRPQYKDDPTKGYIKQTLETI